MMMSIADYARHAGVTRTTVYKWLKAETFPPRKDGKICVKEADDWRRRNIDHGDQRRTNARKALNAREEKVMQAVRKATEDSDHYRTLEESRALRECCAAEMMRLECRDFEGKFISPDYMIERMTSERDGIHNTVMEELNKHTSRLYRLAGKVSIIEFAEELRCVIYDALYRVAYRER
ncbi:hypothetical protein KJE01_23000 [Escherichia marmotae]|nr:MULTISPECIES: hypothetical protein [Escherichia]EFA9400284.1 helix-turn-helix domain-containing protein [Escherichia coli]EFC9846887.1 helix-turn-helix domain-containing protein [Escherichia coli]EFK3238966.1 helix-turn-helix domain-containing protein [Escherichia coli]EHT9345382.1 hypothetical protein [Escherichia coli]EHW2951764.1 hypothetical protein [Escherichia coli]